MFILPDKTSACCDGSYIGEGMFTRPDKHPACDVTGDCWVYFGDASLPHLIVDARGDPWLYWGTGDALGPTNVTTPGRTDDRTDADPSRAGLSSRERFLGGGGWLISTFLMGLGERAGFEGEGIELAGFTCAPGSSTTIGDEGTGFPDTTFTPDSSPAKTK